MDIKVIKSKAVSAERASDKLTKFLEREKSLREEAVLEQMEKSNHRETAAILSADARIPDDVLHRLENVNEYLSQCKK